MSSMADKLADVFCTRKNAQRRDDIDRLIYRRKQARKELDRAIEDLTATQNRKPRAISKPT